MIEIVTQFNDGHTRYYEGERVSEKNFQPESLEKFLGYGWAKPLGGEAAAISNGVSATLDIHTGSASHNTKVI